MLFLIFLLFYARFCKSDIRILDSGSVPVGKNDMALILFVTLESMGDRNLEITAKMIHCCEESAKSHENECKSMTLIGGDMGILGPKLIRNITLIYPNLYLANRDGVCSISIGYKADVTEQAVVHEIKFCTNGTADEQCSTLDQDPSNNCTPVDCIIKYSGERSYYNEGCGECQEVPACLNDPTKCLPEMAYSMVTNNCTNLNDSITPFDLELLEKDIVDSNDDICPTTNLVCHEGILEVDGQCTCYSGWVNTLNENEDHLPSLLHYHMCNIQIGPWNSVNQHRVRTTAIIIAILVATVISKIIVLMCILNWCYKHFKKPDDNKKTCTKRSSQLDESLILCENMDSYVDKCICKGLSEQRLPTLTNETVNVCYYPCRPSTTTSEGKPKSILLSKTTTSSGQDSYRSETECECTTEDTESSDEDYEIQFSEDDEVEEENSSERFGDYEGEQADEQSEQSMRNVEGSSESRQVSGNDSRQASGSNDMSKPSESSTKDT